MPKGRGGPPGKDPPTPPDPELLKETRTGMWYLTWYENHHRPDLPKGGPVGVTWVGQAVPVNLYLNLRFHLPRERRPIVERVSRK